MASEDRVVAHAIDRRAFIGLTTGVLASAAVRVQAARPDQSDSRTRSAEAFRVRLDAARFEQQFPLAAHPANGDEPRYGNRIASFTKGLVHDARGEVDPGAYDSLLLALASGDAADFDRIQLGGVERLVNPQAAFAFDLQGPDSHALGMAPPPAFSSAEQAAEIAENYWMALCRDIPFAEYGTHVIAEQAASDLTRLPAFRGPRSSAGVVTAGTLFRGLTVGDATGPYVSQFLLQPAPLGAEEVDRRIRTGFPGVDFATSYPDWHALQNGWTPAQALAMDPQPRYVRNGRDLANWVRQDVLWQAYFDALLVLLALQLPFDAANPYGGSRTQRGFATFGDPHVATALCAVATRALKAVWFQKWLVHRRIRPEAFAGRIHVHAAGTAAYPIHSDILTSPVLDAIASRTGSYLLPLAFPEGAPLHPSYGAGHATVAGACVTVLKAFFDESAIVPDSVEATADGLSLQPYSGPPLTVGGELNKLASNIALGRNIAGLHWRSDATESLRLGEEVALRYLAEERLCVSEPFAGFRVTRFDGTSVTV